MSDDQSDKILRRLESVEKTLNLIYKDRDVMEQTHVRVGTLTDEVKVLQDRVAKLEKRLVADIQDVKTEIQEKGERMTVTALTTSKPFYKSSTVWLNIAGILVVALQIATSTHIIVDPDIQAILLSILNLLNRIPNRSGNHFNLNGMLEYEIFPAEVIRYAQQLDHTLRAMQQVYSYPPSADLVSL